MMLFVEKLWFLVIFLGVHVQSQNISIEQIIPARIELQELRLNALHQVILIYNSQPELKTINPFKVKTTTNMSYTSSLPVLVVANQKTQVSAWSTPLAVETSLKGSTLYFDTVSKILCHDSMDAIINSDFSIKPLQIAQRFIIALSTSSARDVYVSVELEEQKDFYVELDRSYSLLVSPSEPQYVFFKFDENTSDTIVIEVDSKDDICLTVSVQDCHCPVFDMNKDIKYEGIHQTINLNGAITLARRQFPNGFFLVFVAKPDNYECSQSSSYIPRMMRTVSISTVNITSKVNFKIRNNISGRDYVLAVVGTFVILTAAGVVLVIIALVFHRYGTISKNTYNDVVVTDYFEVLSEEQITGLLKSDYLTVSQFSRNPKRIKKRSYNYLSHTLSIALFYSIPVVQLVVTYQRIVNQSGNEDLCYYNFLCAHPSFGFSDFNHIYSNIGYVMFGIIYIFVVLDRHRLVKLRKEKGIPVHYGLFHAMGVALIIEGLLSSCYHICPSQSNYQFDTSFMYVMAVLSMIKLYQNRHPDINATAYTTFTILGGAIFMAMIGILNGSLAIWIIFIVFYSALVVILSFKIYFLNFVLDGLKQLKRDIQKKGIGVDTFNPIRKARFILLVLANLANYSFLIIGLLLYSTNITDFGTFLLGLLLGNAVIHTIFYTCMKLIHNERICFEAICYGLLSLGCWAGSAVFFLDNATLWTVTPAESRQWNQACILINFFDKHDVWHLLSAPALYFTFMYLMCLDDDIIDILRESIFLTGEYHL
ncbi:unnamed protein product [Phaedon cochleariae]|uniref:SID1 transmembrane family member 1-like n=1 Tax=Phaedon cochleariae TaxID=80249 RepID=A0A9N9X2S8_PHACE|nr:unnamed protein product [Phaedon cochleariae]